MRFACRRSKQLGGLFVLAAALTVALALPPPAYAATVVCGETLTRNTTVDNDLFDCPGNGLIVAADGITVDLAGHTIDGIGLGTGIGVSGRPGVIITNGVVRGFDSGVVLAGTSGAVVSRLRVEETTVGLTIRNASGGVIEGNQVETSPIAGSLTGIWVAGGQDVRVGSRTPGSRAAPS